MKETRNVVSVKRLLRKNKKVINPEAEGKNLWLVKTFTPATAVKTWVEGTEAGGQSPRDPAIPSSVVFQEMLSPRGVTM